MNRYGLQKLGQRHWRISNQEKKSTDELKK